MANYVVNLVFHKAVASYLFGIVQTNPRHRLLSPGVLWFAIAAGAGLAVVLALHDSPRELAGTRLEDPHHLRDGVEPSGRGRIPVNGQMDRTRKRCEYNSTNKILKSRHCGEFKENIFEKTVQKVYITKMIRGKKSKKCYSILWIYVVKAPIKIASFQSEILKKTPFSLCLFFEGCSV